MEEKKPALINEIKEKLKFEVPLKLENLEELEESEEVNSEDKIENVVIDPKDLGKYFEFK